MGNHLRPGAAQKGNHHLGNLGGIGVRIDFTCNFFRKQIALFSRLQGLHGLRTRGLLCLGSRIPGST